MDIARAGVEPVVVKFYRQYMQQINELSYPPGSLLLAPDIQTCLYKYFFDVSQNKFLPPPRYQTKVLRQIIREIEKTIKDPEEEQVSDQLYEHLGYLSAIPLQDPSEEAQQLRVHSYYPPLPFDQPGVQPVLIKEAHNLLSKGNNVGLRTWEGSLHLAWYLTAQRPELVKGKNVLELGAGTGLLSLLCAGQLHASSVLATDGLGHVCECLEANIELNVQNNTLQSGRPPQVLQLDWTDREAIDGLVQNVKSSGASYDLVIGSDITYHPDILRPLAQILSTVKDCSPDVVILISAAIRSDTFWQFTTICRDEFGFSVVEEDVHIPDGLQYSGFFHSVITPIKVVSLQR
ncbi:hypothetical protein G647_08930 [Cladophialophora carrionii CBS 160.54]|uniref:Protein-lysine N-methyltransferase EFM3 n=1 Tax=Cladophialophora carrionii CBS 160.54 TaxID=1279043 RepID=V9CZ71_9EURO|nr:uncharacterized protein G647_08930 [Cladophialophora carrionii CBS 160.54]ETI19915.1 hypothetical protein G647_08930 [Cladophialophora carrionii CBS 160.54]